MRPALPGRPKALLLDGDPAALRLLGRALQACGLDVLAASDGAGGLGLLLDELLRLDVLVVDLDLPGRDAWSMLRLIRGAGGEEDLGVVVLADRPATVRARLLALGADAVVDRARGPEEAARVAAWVASRPARPSAAPRVAVRFGSPPRPALPALPLPRPAAISPTR